MAESDDRDPGPADAAPTPADGSTQRGGRRWIIGAVVASLVIGGGLTAVALLGGSVTERANERSAAEGDEGTRTFLGLPAEIPASVLTEGVDSDEVESTVARSGTAWSASAAFTTTGNHEDLARSGAGPLSEDGFELRQRAYDTTTMQATYDHPDSTVLTVTYRATGEGDEVRVTAVRQHR